MVSPFGVFSPEDIEYQNNLVNFAFKTPSYSGSGPSVQVAQKLTEVNQRAPWLTPETMMTLAKANASTEAIDKVGQFALQRQTDTYEERLAKTGQLPAPIRWAYDAIGATAKAVQSVYKTLIPAPARFVVGEGARAAGEGVGNVITAIPIKPVTRWGVASLDIIPETIQNVSSMFLGQSNYDIGGLWSSTSIATLLDGSEQGIDMGSGYFMPERLREEQARRARLFRGTTQMGHGFTVGRGAAGTISREGSTEYYYASGIIDGLINILSPDPTKGVSKALKSTAGGVGALRSGLKFAEGYKAGGGIKGIVPLLSAEDAKDARKTLKKFADDAHGEAGLIKDITGGQVNVDKFINFMTRNSSAKKMVAVLRNETSAARIQDEIFNYKISNDMVMRLVNAKTDRQVISALTYGWTYGQGTLSANIGKYKLQRTPFVHGLMKSKYFSGVPKKRLIVDGDERQSAEAIKNSVLTMRASAVPEQSIENWLNGTPASAGKQKVMGAIEAYTQNVGTAVNRKNSLVAFNELIALTLKANGIAPPVIERVLNSATDHVDKIKTNALDVRGHGTDNGHLQMTLLHLKESLSKDVYNAYLEGLGEVATDIQFAQPMQIVEMLNRVQILPDVRELRRLTRNRLFMQLTPKDEKGIARFAKLPITSKRKLTTLTKITDEKQWQAADDELSALKRLEGPAALKARERIDELADIKKTFEIEYQKKVISEQERLFIFYIDKLQNDLWKPLSLATFGYIMRNGMDAQLRMAYGGVTSFKNPLDYLLLVTGRKYKYDIQGSEIASLGFKGVKKIEVDPNAPGAGGYIERAGNRDVALQNKVTKELQDELAQVGNRAGILPADEYQRGVETGSFPVYSRNQGPSDYPSKNHTDGIVQQGQKTIADPLQNIAARGLSANKEDSDIVTDIFEYLEKNQGSPAMNRLQALYLDGVNYYRNGKPLKGWPQNLKELRKSDPERYERVLRGHIETIILANVKTNTGKIPELSFMFAHNRVPDFENVSLLPVTDFVLPKNQKELRIGDVQTIMKEDPKTGILTKYEGIINRIDVDPNGVSTATFVPTKPGRALSSSGKDTIKYGSIEARRLIERAPIIGEDAADVTRGLPKQVAREQKYWKTTQEPTVNVMQNRAVSWLFNSLNDTVVRKLEKSPTFRSFYYQTIGEHIDQLSLEEGIKLYDDILDKAKSEGKTIKQYLGEKSFSKNKVGEKIENLPKRTSVSGTLTVEELNDYGRFVGLSKTKDLLYDATERNNFGDAMRIVSPFAGAWADVMGTWLGFLKTENVHMARSAQRVYTGLQNADPDQDGRGFFFRDPQSDQLMFTFPMTGALTKLFTGINAPLAAPIRRLSGGISYYPALGPWGQFAASQLIPDVPDYDQFRQLILPYGEKNLGSTLNPIPGYMMKLGIGMAANTEDLTNVYGQTYIETLRALSVNPEYDLSDPDGVTKLKADAKSRARVLTILRAVSQFTGPTAGTLEFKVPTKIGDVYVSELIKELQSFQQEDYDTAIPRFLKLYGDELMLYASSKTKATRKGLETSVEFDAWTRNNKDLVELYPNLATYFAPKGSDFEFSVWSRQQRAGLREPLSDQELIDTAQSRLGATKYRAARRMFGAFPTELQNEKLKDYRIFLNEKLPGYNVNVEFTVNELENDIVTLDKLLQDPRVSDNPITGPLRRYLAAREEALARAGGKSFQSKKAVPIKAQLYAYGESLAFQNPEFDRIWTRLLVAEVED